MEGASFLSGWGRGCPMGGISFDGGGGGGFQKKSCYEGGEVPTHAWPHYGKPWI